jgi:hypothetical protein
VEHRRNRIRTWSAPRAANALPPPDKTKRAPGQLIADLGKRSELLSPLLDQNKTLLEEAAALRGALRRAEAQREQLAALCRALRVGRSGGGAMHGGSARPSRAGERRTCLDAFRRCGPRQANATNAHHRSATRAGRGSGDGCC